MKKQTGTGFTTATATAMALAAAAAVLGHSGEAAAQDAPYGWVAAPPAAPEPGLRSRTHNFFMPTGETLARGEYEVAIHEFLWSRAAYGLSDRVEIYVSAPFVPVVAAVGARVSLLGQDSPFKLVAGGSIGALLFGDLDGTDDGSLISGTLTAAWGTDRFNIHATGTFMTFVGDDGGDAGDALGVASVGVSYRLSPRVALMAEFAEVTVGNPEQAARFSASAVGVKLMGKHWDADLGLLTLNLPTTTSTCDGCGSEYDDDGPGAIPAVSFTYRP